jgi:hypothetical protein
MIEDFFCLLLYVGGSKLRKITDIPETIFISIFLLLSVTDNLVAFFLG